MGLRTVLDTGYRKNYFTSTGVRTSIARELPHFPNYLVVTKNKVTYFPGPGYKCSRAGCGWRAASWTTRAQIISLIPMQINFRASSDGDKIL